MHSTCYKWLIHVWRTEECASEYNSGNRQKTSNVIDCCVIGVFNDKENGLHLVKTKSGFGITQWIYSQCIILQILNNM